MKTDRAKKMLSTLSSAAISMVGDLRRVAEAARLRCVSKETCAPKIFKCWSVAEEKLADLSFPRSCSSRSLISQPSFFNNLSSLCLHGTHLACGWPCLEKDQVVVFGNCLRKSDKTLSPKLLANGVSSSFTPETLLLLTLIYARYELDRNTLEKNGAVPLQNEIPQSLRNMGKHLKFFAFGLCGTNFPLFVALCKRHIRQRLIRPKANFRQKPQQHLVEKIQAWVWKNFVQSDYLTNVWSESKSCCAACKELELGKRALKYVWFSSPTPVSWGDHFHRCSLPS